MLKLKMTIKPLEKVVDNGQGSSAVTKDRDEGKESSINSSANAQNTRLAGKLRARWDTETMELRRDTSFRAESIARNLLGEPNKKFERVPW